MKQIGLIGTPRSACASGSPASELVGMLPEGARFVAYPSRVGLFPYTAVEETMQRIGHIDAALAAAADGCDAVVIDSVGDYGLAGMRELLSIPAIGAGEAGLAAAVAHGRFGIVTVWPKKMNFITHGVLRHYGYEAACTGIANIGATRDLEDVGDYLNAVRSGTRGVLDRVVQAVAEAKREGCDAVMLGCTCMSPLAEKISSRAPLPVVNPLAEAVLVALQAAIPVVQRADNSLRESVSAMVDAVQRETKSCSVCATSSFD